MRENVRVEWSSESGVQWRRVVQCCSIEGCDRAVKVDKKK